jgi:chromosome segregation protein
MLAALELNGFKSFADRTRLEFPRGITVVVGPNGSGKSNVVDAMKWVLGSQSVKSLRGKEMTDVIFSGSRTRRQANAAEASLILDNSAGLIDHDAQEIQITRRVYRSGEGEYLINRQPCRLRDVRDLLASAGISTNGYSIIEQGRVDGVLQSTPKERRVIFEEAAGISRFRIKREEAARRLERIQQNLLRLGDLVEELQSRLKTVRSQAARAQRYTELADRVKLLRTQLGVADWRRLSAQIDAHEQRVAQDEAQLREVEARLAEGDARVAAIDGQAEDAARAVRETMTLEASVRERLAQCESTRGSHLARIDELGQEVVRLSHQLLTLTSRAGDSQQLVADTSGDLEASRAGLAALHQQFATVQSQVALSEAALAEIRQLAIGKSAALDEAEREAARLQGERQLTDAKLQAVESALEQRDEEAAPLTHARERLVADARQAGAELTAATSQLDHASRNLQAVQDTLALDRSKLAASQKRLAELTGRLTGARERTVVLEELEARLDGLSSGAKEVLRRAREEPDGPFRSVRGIVADLLHVDADTAPLVEVALGERANYLVVAETKSLAAVLADPTAWPGRTTFLRLDVPHVASAVDHVDLSGEPGVIGRADHFVDAPPDLAPLARRLLGRHWLVDTFATAVSLSGGIGRGLNFVTAGGEAVQADGTLAVGPRQSVAGLLSRRSELRALRDEIETMETAAAEAEQDGSRLELRITANESAVQTLAANHAELARAHGELRLRAASLSERRDQVDARLAALTAERTSLAAQGDELLRQREQGDEREQRLASAAEECRAAIREAAERQAALELQLAASQKTLTDQRVELARGEQRVEGLERQMEQLVRDHAERDRALDETRARAGQCQLQREGLQQTVLALAAESAGLQEQKTRIAARLAELEVERRAAQAERSAAVAAGDGDRASFVALQGRLQGVRLELQQRSQQRDALAERLREDYKLELAHLASAAEPLADAERPAVEAEIRELRQRMDASGPVNLEAIAELDALEGRSGGLVAQYEDLQQARARLEQIVAQINGESRQLFLDTIAEIRGHFQGIFRQLFGGGESDLIIEDDESGDVLECGITIIARPPGKQPRNISLLSGGERTLTCVALLLAIFKSRPSPFCVLDEVDAALDEANIDRFVNLIREFNTTTQFIVITHSKRTMTCANTLHGITMQESGVSKRVSVRFEDVGEDGRIRASAIAKSEAASDRNDESPPLAKAA